MKIVILGAGRIGGSLARNLSKSNYQVAIVDENKSRLSDLESKLDIMTIAGHASALHTLKKSGLDDETIVIAVTSNDEVNIIACQIAKNVFNFKKTKCRNYPSVTLTRRFQSHWFAAFRLGLQSLIFGYGALVWDLWLGIF